MSLFNRAFKALVVLNTASFATPYSSGDQVGDAVTLVNVAATDKGSVVLESLVLIDNDKQKAALDLYFFEDDPAQSSVDNGAFTITAANMKKCLGVVSVLGADYKDSAGQSVATLSPARMLQAISGSKNIYMVAVSRGTPTYATAVSLGVRLGFNRP